jgi:archaemetzincin
MCVPTTMGVAMVVRRRRRFLIGLVAVALTAIDVEAMSNDPHAFPSLDTIRAAGRAIASLHVRKVPPRPGDWLERHRESEQTFAEYRASEPNRPTAEHTTIYLQPVGEFDATQTRLLAATADLMGRFYGVPVTTLERIGLDGIPSTARRIHPTWGDHQVLTTYVLDLLRSKRLDDAVAVLALTTSDLWPGEGWNFVFGQASLRDRVGVWSLYRQGDPAKDFTTCLRRTLKTAAHETGHMLGIAHCVAYECGMNGSNHRAEADARPLWFCPEDEMKLWWACRLDPASRFARLAELAEARGLDSEGRFWRRSLAALEALQSAGPPRSRN